MKKKKIFIASSSEAQEYVEFIIRLIENSKSHDIEITPWWDAFDAGRYTMDSLWDISHTYDAGIFFLGQDDYIYVPETNNKNEKEYKFVPRGNVLIEAGLFLATKGKNNVCLVAMDNIIMPTDFSGITHIIYDEYQKYNMKDRLCKWIDKIDSINNIERQQDEYILANNHGLKNVPPVFISNKKLVEKRLPLNEREQGAIEIRNVVYAGTSFLMNETVSRMYDKSWSEWFESALHGGTHITLVITEAYTPAAEDAAKYKMYPPHAKEMESHDIIPANRKKLKEILGDNDKYGDVSLLAYETEIALPYALLETIFSDDSKNHIKVDLYSPLTQNDDLRPSFMVYKSENPELYNHFAGVIDSIIYNKDATKRIK